MTDKDQTKSNVSLPKEAIVTELMDTQNSSPNCVSEIESLSDNVNLCEVDMDKAVFKTPLKRKKKNREEESKQARKNRRMIQIILKVKVNCLILVLQVAHK